MHKDFFLLDEKWFRVDDSLLESLKPGILKAKGVFETIRVYMGRPFGFKEHFKRLERGLKLLNLANPYSEKKWLIFIDRLLIKNHWSDARICLTIWQGKKRLRTSLIGTSLRIKSNNPWRRGFKAYVSCIKRPWSQFSHIKSLYYGCFYQAFKEAKSKRYDEAILLNNKQELVEGSRTNLFFIKDGTLFTPAIHCGCLNGITRQNIIHLAKNFNIPVSIGKFRLKHLLAADEAFLTNSVLEIIPLLECHEQKIGSGEAGIITNRLQKAYCEFIQNSFLC